MINTYYQQYGIFTGPEPMEADIIQAYQNYRVRDILSLDRDVAKRVEQRIKNTKLPINQHVFHINLGSPAGECANLFQNIGNYVFGTQRPVLIHCQNGKDRTGFAVAAYLIKIKRKPACEVIADIEKVLGYGSAISSVAKESMNRVLGCPTKTEETAASDDKSYGFGFGDNPNNSDGGFWADNIGFANNWIDPLIEQYPTHRLARRRILEKLAARYWGKKASGIVYVCLEDNTILLLERSQDVHMGGTWGIAGGAIPSLGEHYSESDEEEEEPDPEDDVFLRSAENEAKEELGHLPQVKGKIGETVFVDGNFTYKTYVYDISKESKKSFIPILNWENDNWQWFSLNDLPENIHPGLRYTLNNIKFNKKARKNLLLRLIKIADRISGGLGDDRKDSEFNPEQLAKGIKIEMEHTDDPEIAKEITKDHLTEDERYYDTLEDVNDETFMGSPPFGMPYSDMPPSELIPGYIEKAEQRQRTRKKLLKMLEEMEEENPPEPLEGVSAVGLGKTYDAGELSNTFMNPSAAPGSPNAASNVESAGITQI